jgi:hypothetical protein
MIDLRTPLICISNNHQIRIRREPLFQILSIREEADVTEIHVEIFRPRNRARIILRRDPEWQLLAPSFSKGAGRA